jgi:hypothetical protein
MVLLSHPGRSGCSTIRYNVGQLKVTIYSLCAENLSYIRLYTDTVATKRIAHGP